VGGGRRGETTGWLGSSVTHKSQKMDRSPERDRERERERGRDRGERDRVRERDRDRDRNREPDRERERGRSARDDQPVDPERAIFVGNLDLYTTNDEVRELFAGKGDVRRVDMKQGYAFVFLENGHHSAIRELDGSLHNRKRLRVELARGDGLIKRREDERRRDAAKRPCETLFVVNFDSVSTRARDLEELFGRYGDIVRIELKRNFAFVQFRTTEEAARALEALNNTKLQDRVISVEFVARGSVESRKRERSASPPRGRSPVRGRSRSPSPRRRRYDDPYEGRDARRDAYDEDKGRESRRHDDAPRERRFEESYYRH